MSTSIKNTVRQGYDQMADDYLSWAQSKPSSRIKYTELLLQHLPPSSRVLELGCGAGEPVTKRLTEHQNVAEVTANDISPRQIELAKAKCPSATFLQADMTALQFDPETLDAVACFFALFHLPRDEHKPMLERIHSWLKKGGCLVASLGASDDEGSHGDFHGAEMFWSSYGVEGNKTLLRDVGFELMHAEVLEGSDGLDPSDPDYGVQFLWVLAKR